MISFETTYEINNGQGWIIFKSDGPDTVSAEYNRGTIKGSWDGERLKGQFADTISKGEGRIEIVFHENGFDAKWKAGLDEGPIKGKWVGTLAKIVDASSQPEGKGIEAYKEYLDYYLTKDEFNGDQIPAEFMIPLQTHFFRELLPEMEVLSFEFDNSEKAKNDGGNWSFEVFYHIPSGQILRHNFTFEANTFGQQFFNSNAIMLDDFCDDLESYRGLWNVRGISSPIKDNWEIAFWDNTMKNEYLRDVLSEEEKQKVISFINADSVYPFIKQLILILNTKQ
jgi:hypothetical protein